MCDTVSRMTMIIETTDAPAGLENLAREIKANGRRMGFREVRESAARHGLGSYRAGSHVAIHAVDSHGRIVAPRLAIVI